MWKKPLWHGGCRFQSLSCLTLCDPKDCSTPGFPVFYYLPDFAELMSTESVMDSLILLHPLHHLPPIFPTIRVFSSELALYIRWPKYWSISFCINPS